jgi:hypothetical protein
MLKDLAVDMAAILTDYSSPVQPGDYVTIIGNYITCAPLMEALFSAILKRGGHPNVQAAALVGPHYSDYFETFMHEATDAQLDFSDPTNLYWVERSDAIFFIRRRPT